MNASDSPAKKAFEYQQLTEKPEKPKKKKKEPKPKKRRSFFWHRKPKKPKKSFWDDIVSVVVLETTQLYKSKTNWGMTFGDSLFDGDIIAMSGGQIPDGTRITFSITYKDGSQRIVKENSGSDRCDRLLQLAYDPTNALDLDSVQQLTDIFSPENAPDESSDKDTPAVSKPPQQTPLVQVGKNQLPHGKYLIGKDIPAGFYDFTAVWGEGSVQIFPNPQSFHRYDSTNAVFYEHIGKDSAYFPPQIFHVECREGQLLYICDNQIVEISHSKPLNLDL